MSDGSRGVDADAAATAAAAAFAAAVGRCGSFGGADFCMARALSQSRAISAADVGLPYDADETSSNDSPPRLAESASLVRSRSIGYVAINCEELLGLADEGSVSSESDTEWKEEMEDAGA